MEIYGHLDPITITSFSTIKQKHRILYKQQILKNKSTLGKKKKSIFLQHIFMSDSQFSVYLSLGSCSIICFTAVIAKTDCYYYIDGISMLSFEYIEANDYIAGRCACTVAIVLQYSFVINMYMIDRQIE